MSSLVSTDCLPILQAPHLDRETPDFISLADVSIRCSGEGASILPAHSQVCYVWCKGASTLEQSAWCSHANCPHLRVQVLARCSAVAGALVASLHEAHNPPSCSKPLDMSHLFLEAEEAVVVMLLRCF